MTNRKNSKARHGVLVLLVVLLSACASKAREAQRARELAEYEELESSLLARVAEEEFRRARQMRVDSLMTPVPKDRSVDTSPSVGLPDTADQQQGIAVTDRPRVANLQLGRPAAGERWRHRETADLQSGETVCVVQSPEARVTLVDDAFTVSVMLTPQRAYLLTDALLSPNALDAGLRVDAGLPFAFESYPSTDSALIENRLPLLLETLRFGTALQASFAARMTAQAKDEHAVVVEMSLDGLDNALLDMQRCVSSG